ncbi:hypothetical protein D3C86_2178270 [compost metagenome]
MRPDKDRRILPSSPNRFDKLSERDIVVHPVGDKGTVNRPRVELNDHLSFEHLVGAGCFVGELAN